MADQEPTKVHPVTKEPIGPDHPVPTPYQIDMAKLGLRPGIDKTPKEEDAFVSPAEVEEDKQLEGKATQDRKPGAPPPEMVARREEQAKARAEETKARSSKVA